MRRNCVCYTTDVGYLFPSVASAIEARRHASRDTTDIAILAFDLDDQTVRSLATICKSEDILFRPLARAAIEGAPAMLARLFLAELLPEHERFLYIDGDTRITDRLDVLLAAEIPPGRFLAVNDPMTFAVPGRDKHARGIAAHFERIGLTADQASHYFNSGVFLADRPAWAEIGRDAWNLFARQGAASRFADQDVLNLAAQGRNLPLSLAWNFPIYMLNARVEDAIRPRVYHYMSNPKPWQGAFPPWTADACRPYDELVRRHPALVPYRAGMSAATRVRYHLQQRYKRALERVTWGRGPNRARILAYEARAVCGYARPS